MQCVILAGGLGTRIAPVSPDLPKALIPIAGEPFAHHQLTLLARAGVREIVYCIGHRGEAIRAFVGNGERWGLQVRYVDEGQALRGTAGALRLALDAGALAPSFLVLYGDSYLRVDYGAVWAAFRRSGKAGLLTVFRNEQRWDASNVLFEDGTVVLYDKHRRDPRAKDLAYIDYGLAALARGTVESYVPSGEVADLADLYQRLSLAGELAGFEATQRFYEIGSPTGLEDLRKHLAAEAAGPAKTGVLVPGSN
jgi:NDP-sugar pyrophosphorylase family protein